MIAHGKWGRCARSSLENIKEEINGLGINVNVLELVVILEYQPVDHVFQ